MSRPAFEPCEVGKSMIIIHHYPVNQRLIFVGAISFSVNFSAEVFFASDLLRVRMNQRLNYSAQISNSYLCLRVI